ncbi:MAG: hypothetical protein Q7T36_10960 [Fluviicoccus sp.]|uniref:hypothetical protein n=1 Tax=Fluviicoccus sp. TaxID=2003552 RepID=UPI00271B7C58|nr:hypothetical protein [Fluviicoccus sp.]MDO8330976.1 hypothetical protein [Fluviicoccus sp.]
MKACFKVAALLLGGLSAAQGYAGASVHDHNIFHGAGAGYADTQQFALPVGQSGALRAQLIWKNGGDLDIHAKPPGGAGPYVVTQFELGPQKNPPFGSGNGTDNNSHVYWTNRQVQFQNYTATATLDADNRYGVANGPNGERVENMHFDGNLPSGIYRFAVHNYNYQKLVDPSADYVVQFTSNGKVGIRDVPLAATTSPMPIVLGSLQSEGQSSPIYTVEIVNPGHDPHAQGVKVVDRKQAYLSYLREQARLAALREAYQKQMVEAAKRVPAPAGGCASGLMIIPCGNNIQFAPTAISPHALRDAYGNLAKTEWASEQPNAALDFSVGVFKGSIINPVRSDANEKYHNSMLISNLLYAALGNEKKAEEYWQASQQDLIPLETPNSKSQEYGMLFGEYVPMRGYSNTTNLKSSNNQITSVKGGAYKDVKGIVGNEAHHMPANSVSPLSTGKGPACSICKVDHEETASYGNSREARAYREEQKKLIDQGKFGEAQEMDILDLQSKFGSKYDESIQQMLDYTRDLGF